VNCPDIEQILDGAADRHAPDIQAHLRECADCRAAARFVLGLRVAYDTALPVSEASIERAIDTVLRERATVTAGPAVWDLVTMAALGGVTCTLALALSGGLSAHPLVAAMVLMCGAGSAAFEYRVGAQPETPARYV
jgi:hypothetical protein